MQPSQSPESMQIDSIVQVSQEVTFTSTGKSELITDKMCKNTRPSGDLLNGMKRTVMQNEHCTEDTKCLRLQPVCRTEVDDFKKEASIEEPELKKAKKREGKLKDLTRKVQGTIIESPSTMRRKVNRRKKKPKKDDSALIALEKIGDGESSIRSLREVILDCLYGTPEKRSMHSNLKLTNLRLVKKAIVIFTPGLQSEDLGLQPRTSYRSVGPFEVNKSYLLGRSLGQKGDAFPINAPGSKNSLYPPYNYFMNRTLSRKEREALKKGLENRKITINDLLMSFDDLIENSYPIHPSLIGKSTREQNLDGKSYVDTGNFDHDGSHIFAIDCEMCLCTEERLLTRVSIMDFDGNVIYDQLVKPSLPITDYLTEYSGITEEKLAGIMTTLQDVQHDILKMISENDILIGHSLESDLNALRIRHPKIVDTSVIYEHDAGPPFRPSLKSLAYTHLNYEIQFGEHDSAEDAKASLDLVKMKILRGLTFGVSTRTSNILHELSSNGIKCLEIGNDTLETRSVSAINFDTEIFRQLIDNINDSQFLVARLRGLALSREYTYGILSKYHKEREEEMPSTKFSLGVLSSGLTELYEKSPQGTMIVMISGNGDTRPYSKILGELGCIQDRQQRREAKKERSSELEEAVSKARDGVAVCLFRQYL